MIEFGYSLQANRQIDMDLNNLRMLKYIRKNEPSIDWCMSCGTCASGCTAAATSDLSLRRMILMVRRGEEAGNIRCRLPVQVLRKMPQCLPERCKYPQCNLLDATSC